MVPNQNYRLTEVDLEGSQKSELANKNIETAHQLYLTDSKCQDMGNKRKRLQLRLGGPVGWSVALCTKSCRLVPG